MRCPSCNKFPSLEIQDPEVELDISGEGMVSGNVRLVLNTECCGEEAKEANFDIEMDLSNALIDALKQAGVENPDLSGEDVELEVEEEGSTGDDRYDGKPGTPSRYRKHFYCVSVEVKATCKYPRPDAEPIEVSATETWTDEIQASAMEEMS